MKARYSVIALGLGFVYSSVVIEAADVGHGADVWVRVVSAVESFQANTVTPQAKRSEDQEGDHCARIVNIDVPGTIFTNAVGLNSGDEIIGFFVQSISNRTIRSFLREPDGTLTLFDAPGAGTGRGFGTNAFSINSRGQITGYYRDPSGVYHGFLRERDGSFVNFDAPGAGTNGTSLQGTSALDINPAGEVAGQYLDSANVSHGFVRDRDGLISTFDARGAGIGPGQGTFTSGADGLNPEGALSGSYTDDLNINHAFVRARDGSLTEFDVPGAGAGSGQGTGLGGINAAGTTVGEYEDAASVYHGFIRDREGLVETFDIQGAGSSANQGTQPQNINSHGDTTGFYTDANNVSHGFLRFRDGRVETFDAPGAGTSPGQGTFAGFNNERNLIVGYYIDANGRYHAFLRTPPER